MNSNQTTIHARSTSPLQQLKTLVRKNLIGTITTTVAGSLLLTGVSTWNIWSIYNSFQSVVVKEVELQKISSELIYQDEALTMSARMLVSTGDLQWETRYNQFVPQNDAALKKFLASVTPELREEAKKTDASAAILLGLEDKSFKLVRQGKQKEAYQIMMGAEYATQKKIYSGLNNEVLAKVDKSIQAELQNYQQQLLISIIFAGAILPILLASWTLVLSAVRDYIRDRQAAQIEIEQSQLDLLQLNEKLAEESDIRAVQEQLIRSESELLQTDIGHILDVVSSIEEGDLTVTANVNERATGLVGDTLNRLIESLDRIVSAVVDTAQRVTTDAGQLEQVAVQTAKQAQSQTTEVRSIQSLMNNINTLTADSRQQAIATAAAVQQAKSAVISGKQAIDDSTDGIAILQQGTDQIVKRSQLLTEFVDLAAQFSKDQKRVASLTRVLALNVSTLSSRAIDEQNPAQFASLAREFAVIARQVNDLATDTNHSLVSLQQRTDRVQTVTSGLNQDISEIDRLVQKFTTDIDRSSQAFDNIQNVTELVSQMSEKVNISSQDIVQVVSDALTAIQLISTVAQSTEAQATITQDRVQSMSDLANQLLSMVEFFSLNDLTPTQQLQSLAKPLPQGIELQQTIIKDLVTV
jgi:methyl-accepting chemotaxis protein PixJ